jgi:CubicO group peptidase (beta-lactamase class C family)
MVDELSAATRRALLHRIATGQADGRAPSLVGAVVRDGAPVWVAGRGTVDGQEPTSDTQYRIGSISKSFVAVLVMRLRDEGRLDLADPLGKHLPGTRPFPREIDELRIAELLAHTSGLASESAGPWWERTPGQADIAEALGQQPMRLPTGRQFHYSNPGYGVLGALVERLRGEPWGVVLQHELLDPLAMTRTTLMPQVPHARGWAVHPWADVVLPEPAEDARAMAPAGQLWSTADDMCRWAAFLAAGNDAVLGADTLAEMRRPASPIGDEAWTGGYGLGLQLLRTGGRVLCGHTGSMPGFVATVWVSVEERLGGLAFANATSGPAIGVVAADLIRIVAEHEPPIPKPWQPAADADVDRRLLELTGLWYWGAHPFALYLRADRGLELKPLTGAGRGSRFRAEDDGTWTGRDAYYTGEKLRVIRDADGTVTHLDLATFVFTRGPYDPAGPVPGEVDPGGWRGVPR